MKRQLMQSTQLKRVIKCDEIDCSISCIRGSYPYYMMIIFLQKHYRAIHEGYYRGY